MDTQLQNLMGMAATAELGGNREEAMSYYNRVLEADPTCSAAWSGKGRCAAASSSCEKPRMREAFVDFGHALATADEADKEKVGVESYTELLKNAVLLHGAALQAARAPAFRSMALGASFGTVEVLREADGWIVAGNPAGPTQIAKMCRDLLNFGVTGEQNVRLREWLVEADERLAALDPGHKPTGLSARTVVQQEQSKADFNALGYIVAFGMVLLLIVVTAFAS